MDWWLFLTPVLVLGAVLLLGFAGCEFKHGTLPPDQPPPPSRDLILRVRVTAALMVTRILFEWTPPGMAQQQTTLTNPAPVGTEGSDSLYDHPLGAAADGMWAVRCNVEVREGPNTASDSDVGMFMLDASNGSSVAGFQATGSPSGGNFIVMFGALAPV